MKKKIIKAVVALMLLGGAGYGGYKYGYNQGYDFDHQNAQKAINNLYFQCVSALQACGCPVGGQE